MSLLDILFGSPKRISLEELHRHWERQDELRNERMRLQNERLKIQNSRWQTTYRPVQKPKE